MEKFQFAVIGHNHKDVVATITIHADDLNSAKEKIRKDPDMQGVRFYPMKDGAKTGEISLEEEPAIAA